MYGDSAGGDSAPEINLASLLNILWRRRIFVIGLPLLGALAGLLYGAVVTPLYEARAIVRPGITAFGTRGGGYREWKLKDLSRWYGQRLYRVEVAEVMGIEIWEVPRIQADFVMRGLQTTEGGNVLTLSILDPDPERAHRILDTSITAFHNYVLTDSTSNALVLSERGLLIGIADSEREKLVLENDVRRVGLDIEMALRDSVQIDRRKAVARTGIDKVRAAQDRIRADIATYELRVQRLQARVNEVDAAVELTHGRLFDDQDSTDMDTSIKAGVQMTESEAYRGLLTAQVDLGERLQLVLRELEVLRLNLAEGGLEIERLALDSDLNIDSRRREAGRKLAELRLKRDSGIDLERESLELQIAERRVQIAALSPIERVGPIISSPRPVRPRKSRAISILAFVGLLGGLGMAFVWEYGWNHRHEIFSREPV